MAEKLMSGSWRVRFRKNGNRHSRVFSTKDSALKFEASLRLESVEDILQDEASDLTFSEFSEKWLNEYCRVEKAETQWKEDKSVIDNHLKPAFGAIQLGSLRKMDLNEVKLKLQRSFKPGKKRVLYAPKTINNIIGLAKKMMNTATEWELLARNPFLEVKKIKVREQDFDFWTTEERDGFLSKCYEDDPEFADAVQVACHTGLRLGELAGLTWIAIDFNRKMFAVKDTYCFKLKKEFNHTKTHDKAIHLPMNQIVMSILMRRKTSRQGVTIFTQDRLKDACKKLQSRCRKYGVRQIRFHDLRHTFASSLAMAGVDLMVIKDLMRHKSYQMTLRYAHLHPDHLRGATDVLNIEFGSRGPSLAHDKNPKLFVWPTFGPRNEKNPNELGFNAVATN